MFKKIIFLRWIFLFAMIFLIWEVSAEKAVAQDVFRISLAVYKEGRYVKPFDRKIRVTEQPIPFYVIIKNISKTSQQIYKQAMAEAIDGFSFEVIDEKDHRVIVKKKPQDLSSKMLISRYLSPGDSVQAHVVIDPDEWENIPVLEPGKIKFFKVRVIYSSNNKSIYSDYYHLELGW